MAQLLVRSCRGSAALLTLVFLASPALAAGDLAFTARLALADGSPAAGYRVAVVGRPISASCDADGRFTLDPAPPLPFVLVATGPAGEVSAQLEVSSLETVELQLPTTIRDSVTVVSGVAPGLDALPGSAATLIGFEDLEQRAPERLVEALDSVAGASKLGDGADAVPALRGLGRGRTLILLDGARVSAERRAGPSATFVEPASLAGVEILRGPGSVVYGSDAFGGVINALTRSPDSGPLSARVEVEASAGALDLQTGYAALSTPLAGGQAQLDLHGSSADDAEAGDGVEIFNSAYEARGGALRWAHDDVGDGRLRLALSVDRMTDLGKAAFDSRQIRAFYPDEDSDRVTASWIGSAGAWDALELTGFYGQYGIVLHRDRVPTTSSNRRIDISDTVADDASLRAVAGRELAGGRLQLGLDSHARFDLHAVTGRIDFEADATTVAREQESVSIEDARQTTTGLFATWNRSLASFATLGVGLRGDAISARNTGGFFGDRSDDRHPLSGNLALTIGPFASWTATVQVARGFRMPTLSDRFFRGPSGRGSVTGNPDLSPEKSTQLDLALRYGRGRTAVAFYAYRYEIDDLIERFASGSDFFFRNRGKAVIEGLELEAQTALGEQWSGELGLAVSDGDAGGEAIDDTPAPNGWLSLRRSFPRGYAYARLSTALEKDDPGPTELERPGYTLLDLGGGYRFTDRLELRLVLRNATDRQYFAAPDEAADRAVGRSFTVGLSWRS